MTFSPVITNTASDVDQVNGNYRHVGRCGFSTFYGMDSSGDYVAQPLGSAAQPWLSAHLGTLSIITNIIASIGVNQDININPNGTGILRSKTYPMFPCVAFVNFDGETADNISGTYARTLTEVVATIAGHGYKVGHVVYADFTSGTAADGLFTVTAVTTDTFTFTHGTSGSTSGSITMNRRLILGSGNVSNVTYQAVSNFYVNFTEELEDENYSIVGLTGGTVFQSNYGSESLNTNGAKTAISVNIIHAKADSTGHSDNPKYANIIAVR